MNWSRSYVTTADLSLLPTLDGKLQAHSSLPGTQWDLSYDTVPVLLAFERPSTPAEAFERLAGEQGMSRERFQGLLTHCMRIQLVQPADAKADEPDRFRVFRRAMTEYLRVGRTAPFPLRSALPLQRPAVYYPGLSARELHRAADYPWVEELEEAAPTILKELRALLAERRGFYNVYRSQTSRGKWAAAYFWVYGQRVEETCEACPETARVLEKTPGFKDISTSLFSALAPGTFVAPHAGRTNAKIRCQLPLIVPDGCGLRVADRQIRQDEGKCVVFDDSFLHTAWNGSDQVRFVLLFDFFHPDLTPAEVKYLGDVTRKAETHKAYLEQLDEPDVPEWVYGAAAHQSG